jgi:hypothetical protein
MSCPILIRRFIDFPRLRLNNEVAGYKFATVGVLYAVLLAFAVIVVWEKFNEGERTAASEAGAVATVYRLADGIEGQTGTTLRENLTLYVKAVMTDEWPAMERGKHSAVANQGLNELYAAVLSFNPTDMRGAAVLTEALRQLNLVTQARRSRLVIAQGTVPGVLWLVLFGGAVLTISFTFFFGTENLLVQTLMTGMLSLLIFSGLLIIIAIDHPFAGSVKVTPGALSAVLEDFTEPRHH